MNTNVITGAQFDTSFIEAPNSRAIVDATLTALAAGSFTVQDRVTTVVDTTLGSVELCGRSRGLRRGLFASSVGIDRKPVSVSWSHDGEPCSPFHGSHEQRTALFAHIDSLVENARG